jgi:hypothetical protein
MLSLCSIIDPKGPHWQAEGHQGVREARGIRPPSIDGEDG